MMIIKSIWMTRKKNIISLYTILVNRLSLQPQYFSNQF
jgi:hypothetical protein